MKSKIRQLIACAATFIMVSMSMEAQTSPVCSVPSPEAANGRTDQSLSAF